MKRSRLGQIRNWPELAPQANWSVTTLAKHCGISARTLRRYFQKHLGISPKAWLAGQRQKLAKELLRSGSLVKETALQLGYQHPETFSREFKKLCGKCPFEIAQSPSDKTAANGSVR